MSEGLKHRKDDPALVGVDRISLHKIKYPIGLWVVLVVQPVQVHQGQQRDTCLVSFRNIPLFTSTWLLVKHIELKILSFQLSGTYGVNVFHHQVPDWQGGPLRSGLQQFQEK